MPPGDQDAGGAVGGFEARLRALHPYTVPEILGVVTTAGYRPYLDWVGESVAAKGGE